MAKYKEYNQEQTFLIAFDVDVNIPKGSFTRFLNDFFEDNLDMKVFDDKRRNDLGGASAKDCKMMSKVIFYAFTQGIYSMRELSKEYLTRQIDFIYLSGYQSVHHSTFSRFIRLYEEEIIDILSKTLYVANNLGYIRKNLIAIDSCSIRANASKKFTGNVETFGRKKKMYEKMIKNLLERANKLEEEEKRDETVEIEKERKNIERLHKNYENVLKRINEFLDESKKTEGKKRQINLIDKDSRLIKKNNKCIQGYNCQAGFSETGIIVAADVSKEGSDKGELERMVKNNEKMLKKVGISEEEIKKIGFLLDRGYVSAEPIGRLTREGYDLYMLPDQYEQEIKGGEKVVVKHCKIYTEEGKNCLECPGRLKMKASEKLNIDRKGYQYYRFRADTTVCKKCQYYERCRGRLKKGTKKFDVKKEIFDNIDELNKLQEKMKTWEGKNKYNKRFWLGEHGFGLITEQRKFKKFLVRGVDKVKEQWCMVSTAFNLRKIWALNQC